MSNTQTPPEIAKGFLAGQITTAEFRTIMGGWYETELDAAFDELSLPLADGTIARLGGDPFAQRLQRLASWYPGPGNKYYLAENAHARKSIGQVYQPILAIAGALMDTYRPDDPRARVLLLALLRCKTAEEVRTMADDIRAVVPIRLNIEAEIATITHPSWTLPPEFESVETALAPFIRAQKPFFDLLRYEEQE